MLFPELGLSSYAIDDLLFQDALLKTDFYSEMKTKSGDKAWALLEKYVGPLA